MNDMNLFTFMSDFVPASDHRQYLQSYKYILNEKAFHFLALQDFLDNHFVFQLTRYCTNRTRTSLTTHDLHSTTNPFVQSQVDNGP